MRIKKPWAWIATFVVGALGYTGFGSGPSPLLSKSGRSPQSVGRFWDQCDPVAVGNAVQTGAKSPPSLLYYYGDPSLNDRLVTEKIITKSNWEELIGSRARFKFKPFRSGLYASESLEAIETNSPSLPQSLIALEIDPGCLSSSRVSTLIELANQAHFRKWYGKINDTASFAQWKQDCFNEDGSPRSEGFQYYETPYQVENECEKKIHQYWSENQIALIQDHLASRRWVIRDPACIVSVRGAPDYWVRELSQKQALWENVCEERRSWRERSKVWLSALSQKRETTPLNEWVVFDQTVKRCQEKNKMLEFQEALKAMVGKKAGITGALEQICL